MHEIKEIHSARKKGKHKGDLSQFY